MRLNYTIFAMRGNFPKQHLFIPRKFRPHITQSSNQSVSHNTWQSSGSSKLPQPAATKVPPLPPINPEYQTDTSESIQLNSRSKSTGKSLYVEHIAKEFLNQMQNLDYGDGQPAKLMEEFKDIVNGHVTFDGIYPELGGSALGVRMIADGMFHQLWAKVASKNAISIENWLYYQKYINLITCNLSHFESTFNHEPSSKDPSKHAIPQIQEDSTTNLKSRKKLQIALPSNTNAVHSESSIEMSKSFIKPEERSVNISSKQNDPPLQNKGIEYDSNGRLRLFGQVQTNKRRLDAEVACFFLKLTKVYMLQDIEINSVLEYYFTDKMETVVLEAHLPTFKQELGKKVIDYRPTVLLVHYGDVSLCGLLRLKMTYNIEGLVVYDEVFKIKKWLQSNGFIDPEETM